MTTMTQTLNFRTHWQRSSALAKSLALVTLAAGAWALSAGTAQARDDVYWSIGVNSPGVSVGVSNAPAVAVYPQPVYVEQRPVYVQPRPVYVQPRPVVIHQPYPYVRPVVVPQPVYYSGWGYAPRWEDRHDRRHERRHHRRHDRDDRFDRGDDRRDDHRGQGRR